MPEKKRCPPFCGPDCTLQHHSLIIRLVNIRENEKRSIHKFKATHQKFSETIPQDEPIPDTLREYMHPLLHWASVLGKVSAVEYLINEGHEPIVKSPDKGQTALHRVAVCFNMVFSKRKPSDQIHKLQSLIHLLAPALFVKDDNGNTPLHICAICISEYHSLAYRVPLEVMLDKVVELEDRGLSKTDGINMKNREGKTVLHILAAKKPDQSCSEEYKLLVKKLLECGADPEIKDQGGKSAKDIAVLLDNQIMAKEISNPRAKKRKRHLESEGYTSTQKRSCKDQSYKHYDHNVVSSTTHGSSSARKPGIKPSLISVVNSKEDVATEASSSTNGGAVAASNHDLPLAKDHLDTNSHESNQQSQKPSLEILLKRVDEKDGIIIEAVEKKRKNLEADCLKSDERIKELSQKRSKFEKGLDYLAKEIKTKMEELNSLHKEETMYEKELEDIEKEIIKETEAKQKISENLSDCEAIVKSLRHV